MIDIKEAAKMIRASLPFTMSHGHSIELAVALLTEQPSWNHFSGDQENALSFPSTPFEFFGAVHRGQRRLRELDSNISITRGDLCFLLVDPFDEVLQRANQADLKSLLNIDDVGMGPYYLPDWFFRQNKWEIGHYIWDDTERLALEMGFSEQDAALIRMLQREAPNHTWPMGLWFEVGVLDADMKAFLSELQEDTGWQKRFGQLYESDGYPDQQV